ncbi:UDP-N-acetylglucosamine diphosphorylase [Bowdeniella nasicola]|uniref:UDP-N-acetylglucosamine diphosphorylase n=1 Tax=Bowdeniella nasicola TaxID=208480 RepID=A0A1Q5Q148_9ACTO|nr:NTP transferase domain-containing protein [Bowdeniella nasicola]OKL53568.1 UDP-N-acetylglucosamine diphosphorylase [Bowdeniella nasicola]
MSSDEHRPLDLAAVVVLAAGAGTRMKSDTPKVLHSISGRSLLGHAIRAGRRLNPERLCVVVRHQRDAVVAHALSVDPDVVIADQDDVPGTGRAVQCALEALGELHGAVVVTAGDTPLLDDRELSALLADHTQSANDVTVLSARVANPHGYGRIVRSADSGAVTGIVEEKDASEDERAIDEINTATYVFDADLLREALAGVGTDNAQGEVYLTDVIAIASREGRKVGAHILDDPMSAEGANDRCQLAQLGAELNRRTLTQWMRAGVTIIDPGSTWIDVDVVLSPDVTIHPGCQLLGATVVATGAEIGPDTTMRDTEVSEGAKVIRTHANLAMVGRGAQVGPFVHLGPDSKVLDGERVRPFSDITSVHAAGAGEG